jgi:hypothetical protein
MIFLSGTSENLYCIMYTNKITTYEFYRICFCFCDFYVVNIRRSMKRMINNNVEFKRCLTLLCCLNYLTIFLLLEASFNQVYMKLLLYYLQYGNLFCSLGNESFLDTIIVYSDECLFNQPSSFLLISAVCQQIILNETNRAEPISFHQILA